MDIEFSQFTICPQNFANVESSKKGTNLQNRTFPKIKIRVTMAKRSSSQVEASKTPVKAGLPQFHRITAIIFRGSIRTCVYAWALSSCTLASALTRTFVNANILSRRAEATKPSRKKERETIWTAINHKFGRYVMSWPTIRSRKCNRLADDYVDSSQ